MRPSAPTSARATPAAGQQRARRGAADATGLVTTSLRVSHGRAVLQPRTAAVRGTLHCCAVRAPRKPEWLTIESIYMRDVASASRDALAAILIVDPNVQRWPTTSRLGRWPTLANVGQRWNVLECQINRNNANMYDGA